VDSIISNIKSSETSVSDLDLALIKARKLKALINIGNSEQIINLAKEDIIPSISKCIFSEQIDNQYKTLLIDTWLNAKTSLAKAYAMQGNKNVFDEINSIKQFMERFVYQTKFYKLQVALIEAFANTIFGEIKKSNQILHSISLKFKNSKMDTELLAEWNLINVINRVLSDEKDGLKSDLFELATFTNNINEQFTKNIIKLILGYVLKEEGNKAKALEIFSDQITYFAKEKVAIGALLSWLLIVQMKMEDNDETALNTAMKSLEIAQSPKINNFLFVIYFQKCLAEIYMKKGDYNATKMYLEKSIVLAKQQNLKYQLIELYITYGDFMQEFMKSTNNYVDVNVKMVHEMYENANVLAQEIDVEYLIEKTQRYKNEFKVFCQVKSI
jgi:tetratricopeptide (TPR) repeat protein